VLDLRSTQLEAFDKYQVSALETLADQLAIAIENARLYDETKQHVKELGSLNEIGQAITSTLDLQEILKLITYQTTSLMNVAAASVALRDDETNEVWFAAASGEGSEVMPGLRMPLGQGLAGWVAEKGEAVIVPDVNADSRFFGAIDKSSGFVTKSILCVPLQTKGHTIGAIEVMNKMNGEFNREDLSLLQALATSAATAIENARLFQQAETLHAFNRDIIRTMTNGLIAVDKSGHITAFNPAATVMLGTEIHKILQQPMQEVLTGNEELIEIFRQTLTTGQTQAHREITVQHWDGNSLPIAVNVAPLTAGDDSRQLMGAVGVLEDLSEVKALEAERRRLDRLAALGEMSAVIAHEIRNPVAGIAAGVEYLTRKIRPGSPDFEGAGMIQSEIKRVNRILEDILFVARPLQLNISEEHIPTIIEDVLQRCQPQIAASQLTTSASHAVNVPLLIVDRQRLEQVFTNLIINATQAMQSGGKLTLHTEVLNAENGLCSAELVITISDTGPGIPVEVRRRVFEPFFTTKTRGTGLGLAVARRIIEEHKGTIKIESEAGQGTRFIIRLPVNKEAAR